MCVYGHVWDVLGLLRVWVQVPAAPGGVNRVTFAMQEGHHPRCKELTQCAHSVLIQCGTEGVVYAYCRRCKQQVMPVTRDCISNS
jgi:hypothetical protein